MRHVVIPVAGFARSGKDTLANAIFDHLEESEPSYSVITLKFADALKADMEKSMKAVGVKVDAFTEDSAEKAKLRPMLVAYGEYRRSLDPDVWVKKVIKEIDVWVNETLEETDSTGSVILIPDLRYLNEYEKLEALCQQNDWAFVPIYIERHGNLPANDQEAESIAQMAAKGCFNRGDALQLSFGDKSVERISQWARKFTQSMSLYR
jgi:hypothetical protein